MPKKNRRVPKYQVIEGPKKANFEDIRTYSESGRCVDSKYGHKWSVGGRFRVGGILKLIFSPSKSGGRHLEGIHFDRKRIL